MNIPKNIWFRYELTYPGIQNFRIINVSTLNSMIYTKHFFKYSKYILIYHHKLFFITNEYKELKKATNILSKYISKVAYNFF